MSKLKFEDDFEESWKDVTAYVASLQDKLEDEQVVKKCLKQIGKHIQKCVKQYAPRPTKHPSYSDAGKENYKHIVDDISYTVRKSQMNGQYYVSVRGGKWTGYKWLWVNDGHFSQKGNWVKGTHFVDKAEAAADNGINEIVDEYLKEALEDNG